MVTVKVMNKFGEIVKTNIDPGMGSTVIKTLKRNYPQKLLDECTIYTVRQMKAKPYKRKKSKTRHAPVGTYGTLNKSRLEFNGGE